MIVKENIEIGGKGFVKQYSDGGFYIERNSAKYSEAIDPADLSREYIETDEPIASGDEQTEVEQKAEAYDYLTGRTESEAESNE